MIYDLKTIQAPRIEGARLLFLAWLMERRVTGRILAPSFLRRLAIDRFRERTPTETPTWYPSVAPREGVGRAGTAAPTPAPDVEILDRIGTTYRPPDSYVFPSVADYARSYRDGSLSPETVAERVIHVLEHQDRGNPPLYAFVSWDAEEIRRQAAESVRRIGEGTARSILEGVPIAVKDEFDVAGHCTSLGTSFLSTERAEQDAWIVARLREAGAMILGKTNMHEIGMGVTGLNPFHGTPVNPYAPWRYPGGSSSGSASVVASGICPIAVGADGGGSVRVPSAYCGVFGLKMTWGRHGERGEFPLARTVANAGPIAGNARDLALTYMTMAGPDPADPHSVSQPSPTLDGFLDGIEGLKIGIFDKWFDHARKEVVQTTRDFLRTLQDKGAILVDVEVADLEALRVAHLITITAEMRSAMERYYGDHKSDFGNETRVNLAVARYISTTDYIKAQQIRTRLLAHFEAVFDSVDLIATPTTANLPPRLNRERLLSGVSDLHSLTETTRYAIPANMLGYPAVTVPAGFITARSRHFWHTVEEKDEDGTVYSQVPVGLQFMARHWQEALLLRMARVCEELIVRPKPRVYLSPYEAKNPIEAGRDEPVND